MATKYLLFLYVLSSSSILLANGAPWPPAQAPAAGAGDNTTEFIRASCQSTLYPDLCFASLARYAPAVQRSPVRLARVAAKVSSSRIRYARARVSAYLRAPAAGAREATALTDCADWLGSAGDLARKTAAEMGRLEGEAVGTEVAWRVSNAQTWMSAALTNEETCTDGFGEVDGGRVKEDVCGRVGQAKQYTSNALALVNCLVGGR